MKGFIFSELIDYSTDTFGDRLDGDLRSLRYDGAAAYPHHDLVDLVARIALATGVPGPELLRRFGAHLFGRFATLYPVFFVDLDSAIGFLSQINGYVHDEVQKLHPDAEFPHFACVQRPDGALEMRYRSARPFADLAEGLLRGCVEWFGESIEVTRQDLAPADGTAARFVLRGAGGR